MSSPYFSQPRKRRTRWEDVSAATSSKMPQRDITDIFLPYAKPAAPSSIPAKRPSPSPCHTVKTGGLSADKQLKGGQPQTPTAAVRFRAGKSSPYKQSFGPSPVTPVSIAIRSPRPDAAAKPAQSYNPQFSTSGRKSLFPSAAKRTKHEDQKVPSFADIPASSQSVIRDGKRIAVKGSDGEGSDSDSLCSLDDILGRNRSDPTTESPSSTDRAAEGLESERASSLSFFANGRSNALVGRDKLRELTSKANRLKFDISLLVGDHFDDEEIEANVTKTKQRYKDSDQAEQFRRHGLVDKKLLASVISQEGSGSNLQRLFDAVERTEALATQPTWSMFDSDPAAMDRQSSFPSPHTGEGLLSGIATAIDPTLTDSSFLTGYAAEKAALGSLPEEILNAIFDNVLQENHREVRQCGLRVLSVGGRQWTSENVTAARIEQLFCRLGASSSKVKCAGVVVPEPQVPVQIHALDKGVLLSTIEMLLGLSANMSSAARSTLVKLTMRLAIDRTLMAQSRICIAVEDAISHLLSHRDESISQATAHCILEDVGMHVKDPSLQSQLLRHILPNSRPAASLRIRLANQFLLNIDDSNISSSYNLHSPEVDLDQLTTYLHSPRFNIFESRTREDSSFDYSALSSLIYTFDIALADGGRPLPISSMSHTSTTAVSTFNKHIDMLADKVKAIHASIADTGASHLRRTEAKEALNALHFRLLYGVRTKPRPKKPVFGGGGGRESSISGLWGNVGAGPGSGLGMDGAQSEEDGGRGRTSGDLMRRFLQRNRLLKCEQEQEKEGKESKEDGKKEEGELEKDPDQEAVEEAEEQQNQQEAETETEMDGEDMGKEGRKNDIRAVMEEDDDDQSSSIRGDTTATTTTPPPTTIPGSASRSSSQLSESERHIRRQLGLGS